jgi:transcription initiation factor TFIIIB Brf1 subunit/transcription initiation factor TFIIB
LTGFSRGGLRAGKGPTLRLGEFTMVSKQLSGAAVALLTLVGGATQGTQQNQNQGAQQNQTQNKQGQLQNQQNQGQRMGHDRIEALTSKLNLNEQQKAEIRKICKDFDEKTKSLDHQLWTLFSQERKAVFNVLTEEQRRMLPEAIKTERRKELEKIASRLGLDPNETQKIAAICEKFDSRFQELAQKQGQDAQGQLQELRSEAFSAIRQELTDQRRAKLPGALREEFEEWNNPSKESEHLQAISQKLNLSQDQQQQIRQIMTQASEQLEQPRAQLRELHQQEHAAIEKVLNDQQRQQFREMLKGRGVGGV